jgi:hypothetical protein
MNIHTGNFVSAAGSFRAPIFYDTNDTNYYLDPTSSSSLRTVGDWRSDSGPWTGEFNGKIQYHSNNWYFQAAGDWLFRNSAGTNVVSINQSGVITGSLNGNASTASTASLVNGTSGGAIQSWDVRTIAPSSMTTYRMGFGFTSWANNNSAPYADYLHLRSYSDGSGGSDNLVMFLKSGIGMRIYQQSFGSGSAYSSFVDVLHSSNFSSYALPLSGGTLTGALTIGTAVNSVIWNDGNGTYIENTGNNSSTRVIRLQAHDGSFNYTQLFINGSSGFVSVSNQMRAPIFYDSNNTGYYGDFASTSSMNILELGDSGGSGGNQRLVFRSGNATDSYSAIRSQYGGTERNTVHFFGPNWQSGSLAGHSTGAINLSGYNGVTFGPWNAAVMWVDNSGNAQANASMRSPIFYDSQNTAYYVDPASQNSFIYGLVLSGNTYFRPNSWIQLDGIYGIFSPVYNNAHFLPNTASSYGAWRMIGNRSGYDGIYSEHSAVNGIMYDSAGNGGPYREANGRWYFYYNLGNDCMGIGTSSTSSTYSLYLNKGVYAQSRIDATIFYDTNDTTYYLDPNGGSLLNGVVSRAYLTASNCNIAATGAAGQCTITANIGSFGGYFRATQHVVIDNTSGGYHIYVIDSNGTGVVKYYGDQFWSAQSDGRIKTVHSFLENNLSKLENINPIYYSFNNFEDDRNRIGLIAQEVQEYFPELVNLDPKTDSLTLNYTGLIPILLGAIKELKKEVDILKLN